eukprot:11112222-Lingulodinium_polyedra.AAC.1
MGCFGCKAQAPRADIRHVFAAGVCQRVARGAKGREGRRPPPGRPPAIAEGAADFRVAIGHGQG